MKNIANRKVSKSNYVIYILLFVALLAVNGLLNFIVASFDPTIFTSATYWVKTFTGAASGLGAFIIFAYMRRDTLIAHNTSYNDNLSELNKIVKSNVDQTISPFVGFKNFEAKRQAWTDSTSHKLQRHHDRASQRILNGLYELETFGEVASK